MSAAKEQIRAILSDIDQAFLGESTIRIAVVGYKDHCDSPNVEFLDFTTSLDQVRDFLGNLKARGGEGWTADVLGGTNQAINASWTQASRCLIHIADAPAHGHTLHDLPEEQDEKYYNPGSEPHRLIYASVMQSLVKLRVNYTFLHIHPVTDRMVNEFSRVYQAAGSDCQLLASNYYYDNSRSDASGNKSGTQNSPRLLFQELHIGRDTSALKRLVLKSVTESITRTSGQFSLALGSVPKGCSVQPNQRSNLRRMLSVVREDQNDMTETCKQRDSPQWSSPGWLDKTWELEGYCPEVVVYSDSTLADMMDSNDNIKMSFTELTVHARSEAFDEGAQRLASYARIAASASHFVVKIFKDGGKGMEHAIEDMQIQALCKAFALEFNGLVRSDQSIDFVTTVSDIGGRSRSEEEGCCIE
jgi:hypothetical protein